MTYSTTFIGRSVSADSGATNLVARSAQANRIDIQALKSNTGAVFIGDGSVLGDGSSGGIQLNAGDVYSVELITDIIPIKFATAVPGEGVSWMAWIGDRN